MVKFLVNKSEESDGDVDHFVVFHEVLVQMIGTNVNTMDDQMIYEKLLQLGNFTIFDNRQNIVKCVEMKEPWTTIVYLNISTEFRWIFFPSSKIL